MVRSAHRAPRLRVGRCAAGAAATAQSAAGLIQAFAGGATIAVMADSLMPEAYREGGWWVDICTAAGFLIAFALGA